MEYILWWTRNANINSNEMQELYKAMMYSFLKKRAEVKSVGRSIRLAMEPAGD